MVSKQIKVGKKTKTKKVRGEGVEFCLRIAPSEVYTIKFRSVMGTKLPEVIVNPHYDNILALIEGQTA